MISRSINVLFTLAVVLLLAVSCSSETEPQIPDPDEGREKSVVDISLSLGEGWDIDDDGTRAAPPSVGTDDKLNNYNKEESYIDIQDVNTVRVITFRRKEGDTGEFYYDKLNDMILTVSQYTQGDHKHNIAEGKLTKTYGYEYRVIAIAYSSTKKSTFPTASGAPNGEDNWFKLTGETYSTFSMKLDSIDCSGWDNYMKILKTDLINKNTGHINNEILQTPHIFYGTLFSENSNSEIIPYAEELNKDIKDAEENVFNKGDMYSKVRLRGILRRGVATIDLYITPKNHHNWSTNESKVQWITVLAQTPNSRVGLSQYDDFLLPTEPIGNNKNYTAIAYIPVSNGICETPVRIRLLPCKTRLAIRVRTGLDPYLRNGQLTSENSVEISGENGTGIVSPDFIDGVFYFRRNHKYTITVSDSEAIVEVTGKTHLN